MYVQRFKNLGSFYTVTADKLYRGQINYSILSMGELDKIISDGLVTFNKMYPSKDRGLFEAFAIVALCVVAVAAVSAVMAGTPAASAGAVSATTGAAPTAATATAVGTAPATGIGTQIMTAVKTTASGIVTTVKDEIKSQAESIPDRLQDTAKNIVSDKANDAVMKAFGYELEQRGQTIEDPAVMAALNERLRREQENYSNYLLRQANDLRNAQGLPVQQPVDYSKWIMALSPIIIALAVG